MILKIIRWRTLFILTFVSLLSFILLFNVIVDHFKFNHFERQFYQENYLMFKSSNNNNNGCKLPLVVDPFDNSVKEFITKLPSRTKCKYDYDPKSDLTFINENNTLMINAKNYVDCEYQFFKRKEGTDDAIIYLQSGQINPIFGTPLGNNEFVNVTCYQDKQQVYRNVHYMIPKVVKMRSQSYQPTVLIIVIESMSRINFMRHMHLTRRQFESLANVYYLNGMTKIADNSFPNMVPFLTGK